MATPGFTHRIVVIATLLTIASAPSALAQSAIAGVVHDSSGGVLPGVSVEAASGALIEGTRTAVTDNAGSYKIENLRPGVYAVTFILTGFRSVKREGINLPTSFTATINAELSVGQLQESVTVTGASPLVDVHSSVSQSVMNRERLDTIPTGKDPFAVGQLIAGVTTSTPDVGGTQIMQQPTLQVHGSSNNDNVFMVDGVQIQHIGFGGNQTGFYFNDGLMDEIGYQTSSLPAEAPVGGVQINMIPRDGGNTYHGTVFITGANDRMQADNLSQDLIDLGFRKQNRVQSVYDANITLGGPVRRDRLWFFGTFRRWSANNFLGNTFTSDGEQAVDDQHISDATIRLTLQAKKNNKFSFHYDRSIKWRGHRPNNWLTASLNVGTQVRTGWSQELFTMRGDLLQITSNGVSNSVRLVNTPSGHKEEGVNTALFAQDSWRLGRLTLNPGLRYERFVMSIPAQSAPAGTWTPARDFAAQNGIVNWDTVSPRLGFSWDVFDDGRTALKGGVSRYDRLEGVTIIQPLNQLNISFRTCPWADTN